MSGTKTRTSRRAFFVGAGAAMGAGVATTVGASALQSLQPTKPTASEDQLQQLQRQLDHVIDREAIRHLHLAFTTSIEQQNYDAATELFYEHADLTLSGVSATGKTAIQRMFAQRYRAQTAPTIHTAYRQTALQQNDVVTVSEDRQRATATFHVEAEVSVPLPADCTAAQMARLQGHMADRRWETGRFHARYVKTQGQWKMASLSYEAS